MIRLDLSGFARTVEFRMVFDVKMGDSNNYLFIDDIEVMGLP